MSIVISAEILIHGWGCPKSVGSNESEYVVQIWEGNFWTGQIFDMDKIQISSLNGSPGPDDT